MRLLHLSVIALAPWVGGLAAQEPVDLEMIARIEAEATERSRVMSTFLLFDRDAVITDMQRTPEDYLKMGLPVNETSLHFKLEDRYVHALDLRTVGRPEWQNRMTQWHFRMMGFRTLRHVGTADHLHVSLPPQEG